MRLPTTIDRQEVAFNMTPMIDIVFLLIIFFLVSSHLAKQESQLPLPLPTAVSGQEALDDTSPRVVVNVFADGQLSLAGRIVDPGELQRRLQNEAANAGSDVEMRIRGDRRVPYEYVEKVLLAAARAGIWNVTFAVYRPEDV